MTTKLTAKQIDTEHTADMAKISEQRRQFCEQHGHVFYTNHPGFVVTYNKHCTMCGAPRKETAQ